jgi:hypothetical protein
LKRPSSDLFWRFVTVKVKDIYKSKELWRGPESIYTLKHGHCVAHDKTPAKSHGQKSITKEASGTSTSTAVLFRPAILGPGDLTMEPETVISTTDPAARTNTFRIVLPSELAFYEYMLDSLSLLERIPEPDGTRERESQLSVHQGRQQTRRLIPKRVILQARFGGEKAKLVVEALDGINGAFVILLESFAERNEGLVSLFVLRKGSA